MTATLDTAFERDLREALLDDVEYETVGRQGNLVHRAIQQSREALEDFSDQYNVGPIFDSLAGPEVERTQNRITVRWRFDHPAAGFFEFGTPDSYRIDGNPILSFVWTDPPQWVRQEFDQARGSGGRFASGWRVFFPSVDSGDGIAETRFTRWALRWLRFQLE